MRRRGERRLRFPTLHDRVVLACGLAWLVPVVVAVARAVSSGWYHVSDEALIAIRARDVLTEHHPLLGTAASAALGEGLLTNHPGPLIFDIAAVPVRLFGSGTGLAVAIAAINFAAGLVAIVAAARQGGKAAAVAVTVGLGALVWSAGNAVLIEPYNPTASMVPFFAVLVLAWATVNGDRWALPWLVGLGSFCVQTNIAYLVTTVPVVAVALGLYVWRARGRHPGRDLLRRCVPVAAIVWAQPIIEQLIHPTDGNVARLARATGALEAPLGAAEGTRQAAAVLSTWPGWSRGHFDGGYVTDLFNEPPSLTLAALSLVIAAAIPFGLSIVTVRWLRDRELATLLAMAAVLVLLGWVGTARVPLSPVFGFLAHYVRWLWPIGVFTSVAVGLFVARAVQRSIPRAATPVVVALGLGVTVASAVPDGPPTVGDEEWNTARPVAVELNRLAVERLPSSGVVVDFRPPDYPVFAFSLIAGLQEHGTPVFVTDGVSLRQFGTSRRPPVEPSPPVVYIVVGFEALEAWDDAVACASALDDAQRERIETARAALLDALVDPGFLLTDLGRRWAASELAPGWLTSVEAGLGDDQLETVDPADLVTFLDGGLLIAPAELAEAAGEFIELHSDLDDNTACVVRRPV
jgi:hypothetical protein